MRSLVLVRSLTMLQQKSNKIAAFRKPSTSSDLSNDETRRVCHLSSNLRAEANTSHKEARRCGTNKRIRFPDKNLISAIKAKT
jgi:hypothetical protein